MRGIEPSDAGSQPQNLVHMLKDQTFARVTLGLCLHAGAEVTAHHDPAEVAKPALNGVICLVSAFQSQELTLKMSGRVWPAMGSRARKSRFDFPPTRFVRFGPGPFPSAHKPNPSPACRCACSIQPSRSSTAFGSDSASVSMLRSKVSTMSSCSARPHRHGSLTAPAIPASGPFCGPVRKQWPPKAREPRNVAVSARVRPQDLAGEPPASFQPVLTVIKRNRREAA